MLTKEEAVRIPRENRPALASKYGVKRLGWFGSYARGTQSETRGVDIVVEFERPVRFRFAGFAEELETLLGKRAGILTPDGIRSIRIDLIVNEIVESIEYV